MGRRDTLGKGFEESQGIIFPWTVFKCLDDLMDTAVVRLAFLAGVTHLISDLQLISTDNLVSFILLLPAVSYQ